MRTLVAVLVVGVGATAVAEWPEFRGPDGMGLAGPQALPRSYQ